MNIKNMNPTPMGVIVFVDIDGVLRPYLQGEDVTLGAGGRHIEQERVQALAEVLSCFPEVQVVVSSTWRHLEPLSDLQTRLAPLPVVGVTGPRVGTRYEDIKGHAYKRCTTWLALDDDDLGWPEEERWRLVRCDPARGLTRSDLDELRTKLYAVCHGELIASMQTEESKAGVKKLFSASAEELGQAAVAEARRKKS